ncbi:MAG: hypothetical protein CL675_12925 [Bdellovibrionaceae bacterium]|nr:hypothetical protein [Pseudobdellovibrionaceae bacterium]
MERRLESVYHYHNYRNIIADDFSRRASMNTAYSLRGYARDLGVSAGYLSKVLNGKQHIHVSKARSLFEKMGFDDVEVDFLEELTKMNTEENPALKEQIYTDILDQYPVAPLVDKNGESAVTENAVNFFTYGLARDIRDLDLLRQVLTKINVTDAEIDSALARLEEDGFLQIKGHEIIITNEEFNLIRDHKDFCRFGRSLADLLYRRYVDRGVSRFPDSVATTLILGYDSETLDRAREMSDQYRMGLMRLSEKVRKPTTFLFLSNLLLEEELSFEGLEDRESPMFQPDNL